jgi:hypothetical protein
MVPVQLNGIPITWVTLFLLTRELGLKQGGLAAKKAGFMYHLAVGPVQEQAMGRRAWKMGTPWSFASAIHPNEGEMRMLAQLDRSCQTVGSLFGVIHEQAKGRSWMTEGNQTPERQLAIQLINVDELKLWPSMTKYMSSFMAFTKCHKKWVLLSSAACTINVWDHNQWL